MAPSDKERRRSQRLTRGLPCSLRRAAEPGGRAVKSVIGDISLHGARVQTSQKFAAGEGLVLDFMLLGTRLENVPATVVRCAPAGGGFDLGVEFSGEASGRVEQALLNPRQQSILLVDDDLKQRNALERRLAAAGYIVSAAEGVAGGWRLFSDRPFDLAIVDLALSGGDGLQLLEKIRGHSSRSSTPVMILTSDSRIESRLTALAYGADHYISKPVDEMELLLWVSALLRRAAGGRAGGVLRFERGEIDPDAHLARLEGVEYHNLSRKEFDLLYCLIANRPRVLSKQFLLSKIWHAALRDNTVEAHVRRLRERLGPKAAFRVVTVPGKGYKFI